MMNMYCFLDLQNEWHGLVIYYMHSRLEIQQLIALFFSCSSVFILEWNPLVSTNSIVWLQEGAMQETIEYLSNIYLSMISTSYFVGESIQ